MTEAVTLVADGQVPDDVYAAAAEVFDEEQVAALIWAATVINAYNRIAIATRMVPGPTSPSRSNPDAPGNTETPEALGTAGNAFSGNLRTPFSAGPYSLRPGASSRPDIAADSVVRQRLHETVQPLAPLRGVDGRARGHRAPGPGGDRADAVEGVDEPHLEAYQLGQGAFAVGDPDAGAGGPLLDEGHGHAA